VEKRVVATVEDSVLCTEMENSESQEEDSPVSLCQTFFDSYHTRVGTGIGRRLKESPRTASSERTKHWGVVCGFQPGDPGI
jgi:hypothetical protein